MLKYTKTELVSLHKKRLKLLIDHAGGCKHLATMLELPYTTVKGWDDRGRISKAGAKKVHDHPTLKSEFQVNFLRPEL